MAIHQPHSFSDNRIAGDVEIFPIEKRAERAAEAAPQGSRADSIVAFSVLAFVFGLLAVFASSATRNAPEAVATDKTLATMYGP